MHIVIKLKLKNPSKDNLALDWKLVILFWHISMQCRMKTRNKEVGGRAKYLKGLYFDSKSISSTLLLVTFRTHSYDEMNPRTKQKCRNPPRSRGLYSASRLLLEPGGDSSRRRSWHNEYLNNSMTDLVRSDPATNFDRYLMFWLEPTKFWYCGDGDWWELTNIVYCKIHNYL